MGTQIGKLVICDRCGKQIFLKNIGTKYLSGGFEEYPQYEEMPNDWEYCSEIGYLCGECNKLYKQTIDSFMKGAS